MGPLYGARRLPQWRVVGCAPHFSTAPVTSPRRNDDAFLRGTLAFASPLSHSGYVEVGAPIKGKDEEYVKGVEKRKRTQTLTKRKKPDNAHSRTSSSQARTREPQALCRQTENKVNKARKPRQPSRSTRSPDRKAKNITSKARAELEHGSLKLSIGSTPFVTRYILEEFPSRKDIAHQE